MKKNGFTLIEVIVAFAITMVVVLFLFQIVLSLKSVFVKDNISSQMALRQNGISRMINDDLVSNSVIGANAIYMNSNGACYRIEFLNGQRKELCVYKGNHIESDGVIDESTADVVVYDDYEFLLPFDASVSISNFEVKYISNVLFVHIPISYDGTDDKYDIKIAYYK